MDRLTYSSLVPNRDLYLKRNLKSKSTPNHNPNSKGYP